MALGAKYTLSVDLIVILDHGSSYAGSRSAWIAGEWDTVIKLLDAPER